MKFTAITSGLGLASTPGNPQSLVNYQISAVAIASYVVTVASVAVCSGSTIHTGDLVAIAPSVLAIASYVVTPVGAISSVPSTLGI